MKDNQPENIFDGRASNWDEPLRRVKLATDVAEAIIREVNPTAEMDVLEIGCGTGLVSLKLQPLVHRLTGADSSPKMLEVLQQKISDGRLTNVFTRDLDIATEDLPAGTFHLIASSMTLHHLPDPESVFRKCFNALLPGGKLAFADLDTEDGSFHSNNTGVHHYGFDREHLKGLLRKTGCTDVRDVTAATVVKEEGEEGTRREYTVFLVVGRK